MPAAVLAADYDRPPVKDTQYIEDLQRALERIGCYTIPVDGKWGNGTQTGIDLFKARRFPPNGAVQFPPVNGQPPTAQQQRAAFLGFMLFEQFGFCSYFAPKNPTNTTNPNRCDRRQVEQAWLDKNPKIKSLKIALDDVSGQLDAIFNASGVGPSNQETKTSSIGAKDIFLAGKLRINNLVETSALVGAGSSDACKRCVELSDWSTLERLAEPTNGILFHSTMKNPISGGPLELKVTTLDSNFLGRARDNIRSIRDFIALINNDPLGSEGTRKKLKDEVDVLVEDFQKQSFGIGLQGIKRNYACPGFEGFEKQ